MKKTVIIITALFGALVNFSVKADADIQLQERLAKLDILKADYTQTITDAQGNLIQEGQGKLALSRPNLFRMKTLTPQETLLVSDGKTLWFYDPFVAQVSANDLKEIVQDSPFVLLTSKDPALWQQYIVQRQGDVFILKPKSAQSRLQQFNIRIEQDGTLKNFSTTEKDGQVNLYRLRHITNAGIDHSLFQFTPPKGVELDDQRKK